MTEAATWLEADDQRAGILKRLRHRGRRLRVGKGYSGQFRGKMGSITSHSSHQLNGEERTLTAHLVERSDSEEGTNRNGGELRTVLG